MHLHLLVITVISETKFVNYAYTDVSVCTVQGEQIGTCAMWQPFLFSDICQIYIQ